MTLNKNLPVFLNRKDDKCNAWRMAIAKRDTQAFIS